MAQPVSPVVVGHSLRVALLGAELVANRLRARPRARLLLPTGHTPLGMYAALRAHALDGSLPTQQATLFQLDEYLGLAPFGLSLPFRAGFGHGNWPRMLLEELRAPPRCAAAAAGVLRDGLPPRAGAVVGHSRGG